MKKIKNIICAVAAITIVCSSMTAYAVNIIDTPVYMAGTGVTLADDSTDTVEDTRAISITRGDPSEMSIEDIVVGIFMEEECADTIEAATNLAMIMTGEKEAKVYQVNDEILAYLGSYTAYALDNTGYYILGQFTHTFYNAAEDENGKHALFAEPECIPTTTEEFEANRQMLEDLYNVVWDVKEATEGMSKYEKVQYIYSSVKTILPTGSSTAPFGIAEAVNSGIATCAANSGLSYLFFTAAGIECYIEEGSINISHAWIKLKVDGVWYNYDSGWSRMLFTDEEAAAYGYVVNETRSHYSS